MNTPYPKKIIFNPGTICTYDCIFCGQPRYSEPIIIPIERIKTIFNNFSEIDQADIGGTGELLLHPDFIKIIQFMTERKIPFNLATNGEYLTEEKEKILRESTLKYINFSLNSVNSETKKFLSGGRGDFDLVMKHFKSVNTKPRNYKVHISTVINRYNFKELPDFVQFGIDNGVDLIILKDLSLLFKYPKGLCLLNDEEEYFYFEKTKEIAKKTNISITGLNRNKNLESIKMPIKQCPMPWSHTVIRYNGLVSSCCYWPLILGNINEESFYDIWNGEKANELREAVSSGDNKFCKNCGEFK